MYAVWRAQAPSCRLCPWAGGDLHVSVVSFLPSQPIHEPGAIAQASFSFSGGMGLALITANGGAGRHGTGLPLRALNAGW